MKKVSINGALGKMGRAIARLLYSNENLKLLHAFDVNGKEAELSEGISAEQVDSEVTMDKLLKTDVVIDFSIPAASLRLIELCITAKKPIVIGTTGFNETEEDLIKQAASVIPVLKSSNMSIGVNMLFALVKMASTSLKNRGFQPEMMEIHHKKKVDSPSGTARSLEKIILENMLPGGNLISGRDGLVGARKDNELGSFALRGGDVVGDHTVFFLGEGERIELKHQATNRDVFASGALQAAEFLIGKSPGFYSMSDVLRL
jgi:4-hydroxy-tetrahydrodipicolinate reductase